MDLSGWDIALSVTYGRVVVVALVLALAVAGLGQAGHGHSHVYHHELWWLGNTFC